MSCLIYLDMSISLAVAVNCGHLAESCDIERMDRSSFMKLGDM